MKKSKVLIPAMALLLFSTAASITGTVAWFTSSRVYEMSAGDFEIAQLDGNLKVDLHEGTGTTLATVGQGISVDKSKIRLVDSSVDLTGRVWRLNSEGGDDIYSTLGLDGTTGTAPDPVVDNWFIKELGPTSNKIKYYAAVSWSMTITYDFASEKGDMGVYLDLHDSQFKDVTPQEQAQASATAGNKGDSKKGFRIMFIDTAGTESASDDKATVWGNHAPELTSVSISEYSEAETSYAQNAEVTYKGATYKCKNGIHVGDENPAAVGTFDPNEWEATFKSTLDVENSKINLRYVQAAKPTTNPAVSATADYRKTNTSAAQEADKKGNYFTSLVDTEATNDAYDTYKRISDGEPNAIYREERIATIGKPSGTGTQGQTTVKCIAWFEGEDPNVVNNTAMQVVGADMTFYTRCDSVGA